MNARLQRWQLLIRCTLAIAAGWSLWRSGAPAWGVALGLLLFWFWSLMMLGLFLALPRINRGAAPPASWGQVLRAWASEMLALERVFAWQQPFGEHREPDHLPAHSTQRGVLLLHGFTCNRGLWNGWLRRLRALDHPCVAISMEPAFGSIDAYADAVEAALQRLTAVNGLAPVIVCHSMGGLAARAWWRRHGGVGREARVWRFMTLGSPHAGTLMARFSPMLNARQMRRGSDWLRELAAAEDASLAEHFDCYYSHCDQIVCPADTAVLPGARAHHVPATGHLGLVFRRRIFEELLILLK